MLFLYGLNSVEMSEKRWTGWSFFTTSSVRARKQTCRLVSQNVRKRIRVYTDDEKKNRIKMYIKTTKEVFYFGLLYTSLVMGRRPSLGATSAREITRKNGQTYCVSRNARIANIKVKVLC